MGGKDEGERWLDKEDLRVSKYDFLSKTNSLENPMDGGT